MGVGIFEKLLAAEELANQRILKELALGSGISIFISNWLSNC